MFVSAMIDNKTVVGRQLLTELDLVWLLSSHCPPLDWTLELTFLVSVMPRHSTGTPSCAFSLSSLLFSSLQEYTILQKWELVSKQILVANRLHMIALWNYSRWGAVRWNWWRLGKKLIGWRREQWWRWSGWHSEVSLANRSLEKCC